MIEVVGNLWDYLADVRVITTNGTIRKDGYCVMGRGCALEARKKWPRFPRVLGNFIAKEGNVVGIHTLAYSESSTIVSFPVKHNWFEKADINLIKRSAEQLVIAADLADWLTVVLPRPGCGNGQLKWEDVQPILAPILDDRFHVITFK